MGKLEDNKKIKREAILDAAFLLFTTKGLTKTSVADITAAAGVAKGTFYLYFKDKYDLRDKLIVHKSNEIFQRAEEETKSREMADLEEHIIANAVAGATEENNFYELYHAMFENSPVKYEKPEIMMYIIIEMISSSCYSSILNEEPVGIEELKPYLLQTVRQIMRSHRLD